MPKAINVVCFLFVFFGREKLERNKCKKLSHLTYQTVLQNHCTDWLQIINDMKYLEFLLKKTVFYQKPKHLFKLPD